MRYWLCHIGLIALLASSGCGRREAFNQATKTTDSLSGAINSLVVELKKTDTLLLQKAIARFADYRQFMQQNINDTIQKTEADNLQHFYAGGESLEHFALNRKTLLGRALLTSSQLTNLSTDIKDNASETKEWMNLIQQEKEEIRILMDAGHEQQKSFQQGFEEFKNALPGVEQLIRSRNRGELPTIIKDTVNL